MKRILLDTHALLWWLEGDNKLGNKAKKLIIDANNEIFISAATPWEISIKKQKGLLSAPDGLDDIVEKEGFLALPISLYHGELAGRLPTYHNDPFDRILIAQGQCESLSVLTADSDFMKYDLHCINALK